MSDPQMVTIPLAKFSELVEAQGFLEALQAAGVDNWEGYDEACRAHAEEEAILADAFDRHG